MTDRVHIVGPYGEKGTVDRADVKAVEAAGGRLMSEKEIVEQRLREQYEAQSTAAKIGGHASVLVGPIASNALAGAGAIALAPEVEAFQKGMSSPATLGLDQIAVNEALKLTAGKGAAKAYAEHQAELSTAHSGWETAGEITGFAAMAAGGGGAGLARAVPGLGVSAIGGAAEGLAARGLAGLAARGVAGRAVATGLSLAARGGVEGALYGASQNLTEQMLGDPEVAADKVFTAAGVSGLYGALGGAALGGTGSLIKSGVSAAVGKVSGLARMAEGVEAKAARAAEGAATDTAPGPVRGWLSKAAESETQKGWAYEQAWKAVGGGQGLQTTRYAKEAARYFENGTKDLGEIAVRHGVIDVSGNPVAAALNGTPAEMLPKIQAASEKVGQRIGDLTMQSGATVDVERIAKIIDTVAKPYEGKAGQIHIGTSVRDYGTELRDVLGLKSPTDKVTVQALLEQRKALDQLVYQETRALDPKMRVQALRDVRSEMENIITGALDDASGKMKGELATEYKALKKDYQGLRILGEAAEDSAARQSKAATLSLTDKLAMFGGGFSPVLGIGSKLVRERGNAAAAVLLYRMAEMGTLTRTIEAIDGQVARSAKGLLNPAPARTGVSSENPVAVAQRAQKQLAKLTSSPNAVADRATTLTHSMSETAPNVAGAVTRNLTRALSFLNSKLPPNPHVDPLSPNRPRSWTQSEATRFARYVKAAEDPVGTLEDIEHGKVTPEAVETLRVLTPTLYRDLQMRTLDSIAETLAKGKQIPFDTRLKLGTLLGIQADPSLNPRVRTWLQSNVLPAAQGESGGNMQAAPRGPAPRPIQLKTQHSAFDRLAAGGPGRR